MAVIKIPYECRVFSGAPITSAMEDKIRQNANPLVMLAGALFFLPLMMGFALLGGRKETLFWMIMGFASVVCMICLFCSPAIFRRIWLKKQIAEKLAVLERVANEDPEKKLPFKRYLRKILVFFLVPWLFLAFALGITSLRPAVYDVRMHAAFGDGDYSAGRGDKCTMYLVEEDRYTSDPIPVGIYANTPRQVGYILLVSSEEYMAGHYPDYNFYTGETKYIPVYMRTCTIEWLHCASGTVVRTLTIEGDGPTTQTPLVEGAYHGSDPMGSWLFEREIERTFEELTKG